MTARLVVGITGATGAVYGARLLERARALGLQTHLVVTPAGVLNDHHEAMREAVPRGAVSSATTSTLGAKTSKLAGGRVPDV